MHLGLCRMPVAPSLSYQPAEVQPKPWLQRLEKLAKRSNPVRNIFLNTLRARMQAEQAVQPR